MAHPEAPGGGRRIWLASFPRSGNTLLRCILFHCFGLHSTSVYPNDLGNRRLERMVGHYESGALPAALAADAPLLVKTHELPADDGPAIYVIRDGRAATTSLWRFYRRRRPLRDVVLGNCPPGSWSAHVEAWRPWERPRTLLLRYEELTHSQAAVLDKLSSFLGRPIVRRGIPSRLWMAIVGRSRVRLFSRWSRRMAPHETLFRATHGKTMAQFGYGVGERDGRWLAAGLAAALGRALERFARAVERPVMDARRRWHGRPARLRGGASDAAPADRDATAAFRSSAEGPVVIVFGTFNYRATLRRWIRAARTAGCRGFRIVCMERDLSRWLSVEGHGEHAVYYYDVLPDAPRHDFGTLPDADRRRALFALRTRLFAWLALSGRDFVHSDGDAFWVVDPRPYLGRQTGFDLLVSQGTTWPPEHLQRYGFVLCAGFFLCRANARTADYFARVERLADEDSDDQRRMNAVLLDDPEARWEVRRPVLRRRGRLGIWRRTRVNLPAAEREWRDVGDLRAALDAAGGGRNVLLTSDSIIRGRFGGGLAVGVIPMRLVTRARVTGRTRALVAH